MLTFGKQLRGQLAYTNMISYKKNISSTWHVHEGLKKFVLYCISTLLWDLHTGTCKPTVDKQWTTALPFRCEDSEKPFGGLITPSNKFVNYITFLEATFVIEFENNVSKLQIGKYLLSKLPKYSLSEWSHFPSAYLLKLFVRMRIHYALKFGNTQIRSAKKKNRKYLKVTHLWINTATVNM